MRTSARQSGFTLIEVSLAIVIGVVVLAGAITLYNQSKRSAGNAKMQEKLMAVGTIIEENASLTGDYPSGNRLRVLYQSRRPDDYLLSPWGGPVGSSLNSPTGLRGLDAWDQNTVTDGFSGGPTHQIAGGDPTYKAEGGISYAIVGDGTTPIRSATASMYDKTRNQYVTYRGYGLYGISPENYTGWFVLGPKAN